MCSAWKGREFSSDEDGDGPANLDTHRCVLCWRHGECNIPNYKDCISLQHRMGCHACDSKNCWRTNRACEFHDKDREDHKDGNLGNDVPHMHQMDIEIYKNSEMVSTGRMLDPLWWNEHSIILRIQRMDYIMGSASGAGCNCLIDSLRQSLELVCNVSKVRESLEEIHRGKFSHIDHMDFLQLDWHWRDILQLLSQHNLCKKRLDVNDYRVICVDLNLPGHGDVYGSPQASRILHICRQNLNHFVPLLRWNLSESPPASRSSHTLSSKSTKSEESMCCASLVRTFNSCFFFFSKLLWNEGLDSHFWCILHTKRAIMKCLCFSQII